MRVALAIIAVLAASACDSGSVPPPGQEPLRSNSPQVAANEVLLRAEGLVAGPEAFYFAAGRNEVEAALTRALGDPVGRSENAECGTGPMEFTDYPGGLIVNFQSGNLVGWNRSGDANGPGVAGEVQIGTSRGEASEAEGFAAIPDSTLGDEFALGNAMGGFFEDGAVVMLYAGAQCFMR
ncbi:MAG: aspartate-semialdehyde dehydrogenase [Erythrobacter sp.]|jgi:hypothetical protein|nr:aspartate-semialdehyde dehydrogenase [Erythrobacter sp.]